MACTSTGVNDRRLNQFAKIRLMDNMATRIGEYGVSKGNIRLLDEMDLNCGAVPEGDFEKVIDLNAPHQFLSMYMQIAENRFAWAVTKLLAMNVNYFPVVMEFVNRTAKELQVEKVSSAEDALALVEQFVLDGMPCDETKQVAESSQDKVVWNKLMDTHEAAWNKAGGDLRNYYELEKTFVDGLLDGCGFDFTIEGGQKFSIVKK